MGRKCNVGRAFRINIYIHFGMFGVLDIKFS